MLQTVVRKDKELSLIKNLFIAYYMGGPEQAKHSIKALKKQTNCPNTCNLLKNLKEMTTDEELAMNIEMVYRVWRSQGV